MNPISLAGPSVEPVSLAEMKAHLRLDGTEEDELVSALIAAGRITVERHARLCLIEQRWRLVLPGWPDGRAVRLPLYPVLSVEAVRISVDGTSDAVLAPDLYRIASDDDRDRLLVDTAAPAPTGRAPRIEIDLVCGFGATPAAVPKPLVLAIQRLVAFWFERRGDEPRSPPGLPGDAIALIAPFARPRLA